MHLLAGMDCYFGSYESPGERQDNNSTIVAFHIPDVGIHFKAPFSAADANHSDLASLLALLEFIDSNQKYFANHTYQIYGNNASIIDFVNERQDPPQIFCHLLQRTREYRHKYRFSLEWIPTRDNPLFEDLCD